MPYKDAGQQKRYAKEHYRKNKSKYLASNQLRRQRLKEYVNNIKAITPCTDCSKSYPYYVMDFDHLKDKSDLIIKFIRNNNKTGLEKELLKCEIVCSNCHRIRTYERIKNARDN